MHTIFAVNPSQQEGRQLRLNYNKYRVRARALPDCASHSAPGGTDALRGPGSLGGGRPSPRRPRSLLPAAPPRSSPHLENMHRYRCWVPEESVAPITGLEEEEGEEEEEEWRRRREV